jgi:hypothetical protein
MPESSPIRGYHHITMCVGSAQGDYDIDVLGRNIDEVLFAKNDLRLSHLRSVQQQCQRTISHVALGHRLRTTANE